MKFSKYIKFIFSALFWIVIWHLAVVRMSMSFKGAELLLPYPLSVLRRICELVCSSFFWQTAFYSLVRVFFAFIIGGILGMSIAVFSSVSQLIRAVTSPLMTVMRATPIASFIMLMTLWLPSAGSVSLWAAVLMTAPIFWANIASGIDSVDTKLLDMARVYDFSSVKTVRYIYLPSLKASLLSACESGVGLAWKAAVAAEVLTRPEFAIGRMVYETKLYFETTDLFAWTAVVILFSVMLEQLVQKLIRRATGE